MIDKSSSKNLIVNSSIQLLIDSNQKKDELASPSGKKSLFPTLESRTSPTTSPQTRVSPIIADFEKHLL